MGFMQLPDKENLRYYERRMTHSFQMTLKKVTSSGTYTFAQDTFSFSKKFTVTKSINSVLGQQGQFGNVLKVMVTPVSFLLDIVILLLGIMLGSMLISIIYIILFLLIIYLIITSFFKK
ncbi:aminotransferase class IV [Chryseobacterium limigenitum]|uniref:Uncharacterized protein n=1 Tax=Chryseobacterium limigenitum TaxID=1612149 RepID=A0A1K2ISS8_9FLAO|nr:hypothetical protein [Chryseobacterium limigenitum]SFZ95248.1 hypothetical protein SAMN05216324_10917 [Chryseobacterium limigenitum]